MAKVVLENVYKIYLGNVTAVWRKSVRQKISLFVEMKKTHFFDIESEQSII